MGVQIQLPSAPVSTIGTTAGTVPVNLPPSSPVSATAAANTAVAITITGIAGQSIRITHLSFAYVTAPTGGGVTIVVNGVTIWQMELGSIAPQFVQIPDGGFECAAGFNAVITLAAAGAAVVGQLNVASLFGS